VGTSRATQEGVEAACKRFCTAAGIFQTIKTSFSSQLIGQLPVDLSPEWLTMLQHLMLAQAQICYYELAKLMKKVPESLAKIAAHVGDLYASAHAAVPESLWSVADTSFQWSAYLRYYAASFHGASFWQSSLKAHADAETKGEGYGVEIAWLRVAENAAIRALDTARQPPRSTGRRASAAPAPVALDTSTADGLLGAVRTRLVQAEKDNNAVYMNLVPSLADLPNVPRAELAKPFPVDFRNMAAAAPDMFEAIVPPQVAQASGDLQAFIASSFEEGRTQARKAAEEAKARLAALGLPGYLDASSGDENSGGAKGGLPEALWERVKRTQVAGGGVAELDRMFAANQASAESAASALTRAEAILSEEDAEDANWRSQFGERWAMPMASLATASLSADVAKYQRLYSIAVGSDAQVREKLDAARPLLALLARTRAEIDASVPSTGPAATDPAADPGAAAAEQQAEGLRAELRSLLGQLDAVYARRAAAADAIKASVDRSEALKKLLAAPAQDHHAIVEGYLSASRDAFASAFDAANQEQARLLDSVQAVHTRLAEVRRLDARTVARERAIQNVGQAVDKFDELRSDLKGGEGFYRDLSAKLSALVVEAGDLRAARGLHARELAMHLRETVRPGPMGAAPPMAISPAAYAGPAVTTPPAVVTPAAGPYNGPGAHAPASVSELAASVAATHIAPPQQPPQQQQQHPQQQQQHTPVSPTAAVPAPSAYPGAPGHSPAAQQHSPGPAAYAPAVGYPAAAVPPPASTGAYPGAQYPPQQQQQYHPQQPQQQQYAPPAYGQPAPYSPYGAPAPNPYGAPYGGPPAPPAGYYMPPQQQQYPPQPQYAPSPYGQPAPQMHPGMAPQMGMYPPTPQLQQLLSMGFEYERSSRALATYRGDVNAAISALVEGRI
jgi:programmed cell death 6-interacting protein